MKRTFNEDDAGLGAAHDEIRAGIRARIAILEARIEKVDEELALLVRVLALAELAVQHRQGGAE